MTLVIFYALFAPLAYLSLGLVLLTLLVDFHSVRTKKVLNPLNSISDSIIAAMVLSSSSLVIPAVLIGTQPRGTLRLPFLNDFISFPLVFYLHGILAFGSLIYLSLTYINKVILAPPSRILEKTINIDDDRPMLTLTDLLQPVKTMKAFLKNPLIHKQITKTKLSLISLIGLGVLLEMTVLSLILPPERGYDALAMYFPEARVYFLLDQITKFDPLATRPTVKAPFIILLITWSWYLFARVQIQLLPILFVLATALAARQLVLLFDENQNIKAKKIKADLAFTGTLILPLIFWFLMDWPFYQDIYVGFFYATALYWTWKAERTREKKTLIFFHILAALSIACALLSKINAWTIFIILLLTFPTNHRLLKHGKATLLLGLFFFLSYKVSVNLYVGFVLLYLLWILVLLKAVYEDHALNLKAKLSELPRFRLIFTQKKRSFDFMVTHQKLYLLTLLGGLLLGGHWLIRNFQLFPGAKDDFFSRYLKIPDLSLIKTTPDFGVRPLSSLTYETIHGISPHGVALLIFFGTSFVAFWGIFKILGIIKGDGYRMLVIWLGMYILIWTTYYGNSSARYLSLIIVPLVIISVHGLDVLLKWLENGKKDLGMVPQTKLLAFLALAPLNYYYIPNLSLLFNYQDPATRNQIGLSYLQAARNYYQEMSMMLLLGILGLLFISLLLNPRSFIKKILTIGHMKITTNTNKVKWIAKITRVTPLVSTFAFIILFVVPLIVPASVFVSEGGNIDAVVETVVLFQDDSYQQVIEYLQLHFSPTDGVLSFNVPGIGAKTDMPTLEVMMIPPELPINKRPWLAAFPAKDVLSFMSSPLSLKDLQPYRSYFPEKFLSSFGFTYVVVPTPIYYWWNSFDLQYLQYSTLIALLDNPQYFSLVLSTEYYFLFKMRDGTDDFGGLLDLQLVNDEGYKVSLIGPLSNINSSQKQTTRFENLELLLDFSGDSYQLRGTQTLNINVTIHLADNTSLIYQEKHTLTELANPTPITILNSTSLSQVNLTEINIKKIVITFTLTEDPTFLREIILTSFNPNDSLHLKLSSNSDSLILNQPSTYLTFKKTG